MIEKLNIRTVWSFVFNRLDCQLAKITFCTSVEGASLAFLNCETDFVAKTDDFKQLAHYLAMQIASMNPLYVAASDIPASEKKRVEKEYAAKLKDDKKPASVKQKIIAGQVEKHFEDQVLLSQKYILDDKLTVADFIKSYIAKTGENISVNKFRRIELGVNE
ncbi:MAG: hypothetical protein LBQ02_00595 [Candidatus Nomurabacteria bacterium]|jgi:elongation factor Ts|nr:hypothetical protein [Candidatus Nomurabacteria bacterium]